MSKTKSHHKYILTLYSRVDDFLSSNNVELEEIGDAIVSFCIVLEKVLKLKLYEKNPLLVFDPAYLKDDSSISIITLKKEKEIETLRIKNIIDRFAIVFKKVFTPNDLQALRDLYDLRNCFIHGYKTEDQIIFDREDAVKKMGTLWDKIPKIVISLFGKDAVKKGRPKKKYTEKELEGVLEAEVRKMIEFKSDSWPRGNSVIIPESRIFDPQNYSDQVFRADGYYLKDKCPRCGRLSFSVESKKNNWDSANIVGGFSTFTSDGVSNLYKCSSCNLELTEKQYEIAKRINANIGY